MQAEAPPPAREPEPARSSPGLRLLRLVPVVAAAAVVLFVALGELGGGGSRSLRVAHLASVEPLPVQTLRGGAEPGSFDALYEEGSAAYRDRDWARAATRFEAALALEEDALAALYLGSARLLATPDEPGRAAVALRRAVDAAVDPLVREEALWQLAQAHVLADEAGPARTALESARELAGRRAADVEALLVALPRP